MEDKNDKKLQRQTYPPCDTCGEKHHTIERYWQGPGVHLRQKLTGPDKKPMMLQAMKEHPRKQIMPKRPTQVNQNKKTDSKN